MPPGKCSAENARSVHVQGFGDSWLAWAKTHKGNV